VTKFTQESKINFGGRLEYRMGQLGFIPHIATPTFPPLDGSDMSKNNFEICRARFAFFISPTLVIMLIHVNGLACANMEASVSRRLMLSRKKYNDLLWPSSTSYLHYAKYQLKLT
jgi:hypothetical protein